MFSQKSMCTIGQDMFYKVIVLSDETSVKYKCQIVEVFLWTVIFVQTCKWVIETKNAGVKNLKKIKILK